MIRFIDVYKSYDNGTKALKGVSMRIDDGEFVFLVGPSGSGKSTIIKLITAEIAPSEGRLMVNGQQRAMGFFSADGVAEFARQAAAISPPFPQ